MRLLQTYILYFCNNLSIGNLKENLMVYMVRDITVNLLYSDFFCLIIPPFTCEVPFTIANLLFQFTKKAS